MSAVEIPVDDRWIAATGVSKEAVEREFRGLLAARLFELRRVTLAQAAAMAGMNLWQFLEFLGSLGTSVINLTREELIHDLGEA